MFPPLWDSLIHDSKSSVIHDVIHDDTHDDQLFLADHHHHLLEDEFVENIIEGCNLHIGNFSIAKCFLEVASFICSRPKLILILQGSFKFTHKTYMMSNDKIIFVPIFESKNTVK